jgi:TetR/AcrR family transcriptional regulator, mexJK operon transcriptional repressor
VPDVDVAVMRLFALTLYPHFFFSSFGDKLEDDLAERLLTEGVPRFLARYATAAREADGSHARA